MVPLQKLQELLSELFQLDNANLDFGIYRIMKLRRDELHRFINKDLLDAVHKAVSIGGDTDTLGSITDAIAAAYYNDIPPGIIKESIKRFTSDLRRMVDKFGQLYC